MSAKTISAKHFEESVRAFLRAHLGVVHREDVGPLFGLVATLPGELALDASVRRRWTEAVSTALAPHTRDSAASAVQWTRAVLHPAPGERQSRMSALAPGVHAALRASIRASRRAGR
ncbi:MAG: hypothetical protein ABI920_07105 [Casimicrobiaceae bacterium]